MDNGLLDLVAAVRVFATGGSTLSSYGTVGYANNYSLITLNRIILTYLYTGNGIFQTAIQLPIQDAFSKGIELESGELSPEDIDAVLDWIEDHQVFHSLQNAIGWSRVYGGGALIINSNQDPETPLDIRRFGKSAVEFYDVDRWQLTNPIYEVKVDYDYDDMSTAEFLFLNGQKIHASRCIILTGKRAPSYIRRQLRGWGMSEAERMLRDLNNYLKTGDVLYEILDESKLDIYKIKDLANKLLTAGGTSQITKRIQAANEVKNYVNALILDMEEEYEQKNLQFGGLADVMRENRIGVASALRMPMTKLFGLSASGFSTGESDTDNYNEMVESEIRSKVRPAVRKCIEFACAHLFGYIPTFRFKFPSLKVLEEVDAEEVRASKTNRALSLFDRGLIDSPAVGAMLHKDDALDIDIDETPGMFPDNPVPPNGEGSVLPVENNPITVYKNAAGRRESRNAQAQG